MGVLEGRHAPHRRRARVPRRRHRARARSDGAPRRSGRTRWRSLGARVGHAASPHGTPVRAPVRVLQRELGHGCRRRVGAPLDADHGSIRPVPRVYATTKPLAVTRPCAPQSSTTSASRSDSVPRRCPFRVFGGRGANRFRLYGGGLRDLVEGWSKNFASGAGSTPIPRILLVFAWVVGVGTAA
jgi:hypothetical protein